MKNQCKEFERNLLWCLNQEAVGTQVTLSTFYSSHYTQAPSFVCPPLFSSFLELNLSSSSLTLSNSLILETKNLFTDSNSKDDLKSPGSFEDILMHSSSQHLACNRHLTLLFSPAAFLLFGSWQRGGVLAQLLIISLALRRIFRL